MIDKVLSAVEIIPETGCWIYTGELNRNGYGTVTVRFAKLAGGRWFIACSSNTSSDRLRLIMCLTTFAGCAAAATRITWSP